jgi:hypothetical protein
VARFQTLLTHLESSRTIYYAAVRADPQPEARAAEIGHNAQALWCFLLPVPSLDGAPEATEQPASIPIADFERSMFLARRNGMFGRFAPTRALKELIWYELGKAMWRGLITLCAVEALSVALAVGLMYELFGQWPSVELWLAIIGLSIIPAVVAEHLMIRWTLKRDIRLIPETVATKLVKRLRRRS